MINFLPFALHLIILLQYIRRSQHKICLSNFILALHTLSMFAFGVLAVFFYPDYYFTFKAYLLMLFTLLILLYPLRKYENKIKATTKLAKFPILGYQIIVVFLIVISLYSCVFFTRNLLTVFSYGIDTVRTKEMVFYQSSIFSKIAIVGAFCSCITVFMFFYTLIQYGMNRTAKLLLFSSFSFILYTLNAAGRDGMVIWALSFVASYCLFYPYLSIALRSKIIKLTKLSVIIILPIFIAFTMARFSKGGEISKGVESIFSYIGQPLANLSYEIDFTEKIGIRSGDGYYPVEIAQMVFSDKGVPPLSRMDRIRSSMELGFRSNQFSSYIGGFYPGYPIYVLFFFVLICFLIFSLLNVKDGYVKTSTLLISFSWYMILVVGIFYFYYSELSGNVYLLIPFLFSVLLKLKAKRIEDQLIAK